MFNRFFQIIAAITFATSSFQVLSCQLRESNTTLMPGTWVEIVDSGFETSTPDTILWAFFDFGEDSGLVPAFVTQDSGFEFVVPPTFHKPWESKPIVSLWLTDGEYGCEINGLKHGALEKTPRNLRHLLAMVGNGYGALAADMGFTQEDIAQAAFNRSSVKQNPVLAYATSVIHLLPYFKSLHQQSLESKEVALALDVVSAYIAASGVLNRLEELEKINQEFLNNAAVYNSPPNTPKPIFASADKVNPLYDYSNLETITRPIETNWSEPKTASELAIQMRKQYRATLANSSHKKFKKGEKIDTFTGYKTSTLRDTAGTVLGLGSLAATKIPGRAGKAVGFSYTMVSHHLFMQAFGDKLVDGLYPNKFESISIANGPWRIFTQKPPKRATVNKIMVVTSAKGLNMAQIIADVVNNFFPYGKTAGAGLKVAQRATSSTLKKIGPELANRFTKLNNNITKGQSEALSSVAPGIETIGKQVLSQKIGDAKFDGPLSAFSIPKFTLPPINILEPGFYHAYLDTNEHLLFDAINKPTLLFYNAKSQGDTTLTYQPKPGLWGNNTISGTQLIQVDPDDLWISPTTQTILPGDQFSVTIKHTSANTRNDDFDLDISLSDGFKVLDVSRPLHTQENGTQMVSWVVDIQSSNNRARFPGDILVRRFSNPSVQAKARVDAAVINPRPICVDTNTNTQFQMLDENGQPFTDLSWSTSKLGNIGPKGMFDSGTNKGKTTVLATTSQGIVADQLELTIGCGCFWRLTLDGEQDQGKVVTSGAMKVGPTSTYLVNFIDAKTLVPAITGQGTLVRPSSLSLTVQKADTSYVSGMLANTNVLSGLQGKHCAVPSNKRIDWSIHNKRWLSAHIIGTAATMEELGTACIQNTTPFSLQFMLDLGDSTQTKDSQLDPTGIEAFLGGLLSTTEADSGCLADQ